MNHYICIHGHFYQPPRENPWLETVEKENSAAPYHDWNERITEECYQPNAHAKILNEKKDIVKIVNNYSKISFNFGPTLLSWIEEKNRELYLAIIKADKDSQQQFEGHGNAIAQVYNHIILPLANTNDKLTQIIWGIRDFEHRFNRKPEGMWLPETAVNFDSLVLMAEQGIKFTILAQHQARQIRKIGSDEWQKVQPKLIDPTMPYLLNLPNNRSIVIFFYDGKVSQEVAFSSTLEKGENLVGSMNNIFTDQKNKVQLAHIATDGETYGHHHIHGDMALAYALNYIEQNNFAKLINYGQFLAKYPPSHEVEIIDNSSWSCIHGIERWKSACGCNSGEHSNWRQNWRAPLREAFDWLRDKLWGLYSQKGLEIFKDPVKARNDYIDVILSRSSDSLSVFFAKNVNHALNEEETVNALMLLEIQRNAMLMYTSCGWFFDELSGITTVQVIKYAARAIQLAQKYFPESLEHTLLDKLVNCKSNIKQYQDGKFIYLNFVKPLIMDWDDIVSRYAVTTLFENYKNNSTFFCYNVETLNYNQYKNGRASLNIGLSIFISKITTEKVSYIFTVINFGDKNICCRVKKFNSFEEYNTIIKNLISAFNTSDMVSVSNLINKYMETSPSV